MVAAADLQQPPAIVQEAPAAPDAATVLAPLAAKTDLAAGHVAFVANGPLAVREYRLTGPPRLVVEFDGARVAGRPLRIAPGGPGPIRAGGLYQSGPGVARAVFLTEDPARLALLIEPLGPRHTRFVVAPVAAAGGGAGGRSPALGHLDALAWQGGYLKARGSRPLVARVAPLPDGAGYVLEFAGARLADPLAAFAVEPGGPVRRVRALEGPGGVARVAVELARPAAFKLRPAGGAWWWGPVPAAQDAASAALRQALGPVLARRPRPAAGFRPAHEGAGAWKAGSHFLVTSNVAQFGAGPLLAGTRHRYGGHVVQDAPALAGVVVGHLDAQILRFTEPRFDYVNTLASLALAHPLARLHPLAGPLHVFEGAAALHRKEAYASTVSMLDASLFAGLGYGGALPLGGAWAASVLADRVAATDVRRAYYGQAARLRAGLPLGAGVALSGQATFQRLDPVVRSQAFYREYLDLGAEWAFRPGSRLGLLVQAGLQQRLGATEAYLLGGPTATFGF